MQPVPAPRESVVASRRVIMASVCAAVLLAAMTVSLLGSIDRIRSGTAWVAARERELVGLERLQSALAEVEAASRGYAVTGREEYLIAFNDAQPVATASLAEVKALADSVGLDRALPGQLAEVAQAVVRDAHQVIRVQQSEGAASAHALLASGRSHLLQSELSRLHQSLDQAVRRRLQQREEDAAATQASAKATILGGTVLACGLLGAGCLFVIRDLRRRRAIADELSRYAELERENTARVSRLAEFGQLLHSCQTPHEVHGVVGAAARDLFEADGCLYRLRSSKNLFERAVDWGLPGPDSFDRDGCWAMRRGRPHTSGPGLSTPRCQHLADAAGLIRCVPLTNQGETIGILVLESTTATLAEDHWRRLSSAAAEQLASALGAIALRERLRAQSIRDELTGLFNRRFFEEALERETRRALRLQKPVSLLLFDIDHFKRFNDTWGHDAGDAVLREVGALVRTMFRTEDVACRYGGEEFVLILSDADLASAAERASQLRHATEQLRVAHRHQMLDGITLSIGIACTTEHGPTGASLLSAADQAMYAAKRAGRNRVVTAEPSIADPPRLAAV